MTLADKIYIKTMTTDLKKEVEINAIVKSRSSGDPHFTSFNGCHYDFMVCIYLYNFYSLYSLVFTQPY